MQSEAKTVRHYLSVLPRDRREALQAVRAVILENLPKGCEEGMQYGMIGYFVPHSVYPAGYHCDPKQPLPFAGLASQKNHMALYLMCVYGNQEHETWFRKAWARTGKKLDMGKSCVRFKRIDDLPLQVVGEAIRRVSAKTFIEHYETTIKSAGTRPRKPSATKRRATSTRGELTRKPARGRPVKTTSANPAKKRKTRGA